MKRLRQWFKEIVLEALKDRNLDTRPYVISLRCPTPSDWNFTTGSIWENRDLNKLYILREIKAEWEELK